MNKFLLSLYREVDELVLDFTRYPVCLVCVRNGPKTNRITFETKKIEKKRPVLSIGRTRTSKGHVAGLVIGRTLIREGHLPGPVIGRTLRKEGQLPVYPLVVVIGGTLIGKGQQLA